MELEKFVNTLSASAEKYPDVILSAENRNKVYTCVNPYSYHIARRDYSLYSQMDGLFSDGILMCRFVNKLWGRKIPRLSFDMVGMARDLFQILDTPERNDSIYFIGARQEEVEKTVAEIKSTYPGMNVVGFRNGYFKDEAERSRVIADIIALNPDYTIVGMGSPLQEKFALDLHNAGYRGVVFTCGGFLHQTSQGINYYPAWIDRYNLRAFYRLFHEKGLTKRLYNIMIEFPVLFTLDTLRTRLSRKN